MSWIQTDFIIIIIIIIIIIMTAAWILCSSCAVHSASIRMRLVTGAAAEHTALPLVRPICREKTTFRRSTDQEGICLSRGATKRNCTPVPTVESTAGGRTDDRAAAVNERQREARVTWRQIGLFPVFEYRITLLLNAGSRIIAGSNKRRNTELSEYQPYTSYVTATPALSADTVWYFLILAINRYKRWELTYEA